MVVAAAGAEVGVGGLPAVGVRDAVIVDRSKLTCEIYSTWNMHNAHLLHGPLRTVLEPNETIDDSICQHESTTRCTSRLDHRCCG
jgi:hypothetical protein